MNLNPINECGSTRPSQSRFTLSNICHILGRSYRFVSNISCEGLLLIYNLFFKAVAWTKKLFGVIQANIQTASLDPSTEPQQPTKPVSGNDSAASDKKIITVDNKTSFISQKSTRTSREVLSTSVEKKQESLRVLNTFPECEMLNRLLEKFCMSFSAKKNAELHARNFFVEFETAISNLDVGTKNEMISQLIVRQKEIEYTLSKYIKPAFSNITGEAKHECFSKSDIDDLKKHFFGINFAFFVIENAPIENLDSLRRYMQMFRNVDIFTENVSLEVLSDILSRLSNSVISASSFKFETLKSQIEFLEDQIKKGVSISKQRLQPEVLAVEYDSESDESEEGEGEFVVSATIHNFNLQKMLYESNDIHETVLSSLKKRAALCRLEEYNSKIFNPVTFLRILRDVDHYVGDIEASHELFAPLQEAFDKLTLKYSDSNTVFDMFDLNKIKVPHSILAKKLGAAALSDETVSIIPDTDDDLLITSLYQQEENAAIFEADLQFARNLAGY
ncbi:MAG: hypothetical protein H0W50_07355 [Parachlamydiaceae bacterium]|nr:hypothetical protein [Parachlamydiaceae bacterium]